MQGFCPNCNTELTENNVVSTKESAIFKGHNVYCMCKHCGYVMIYNKDRDLIFCLDKFKDDEDIIKEIYDLLNEATDNSIESVSKTEEIEEVEHSCEGNCSSCSGCKSQIEESIEMILSMAQAKKHRKIGKLIVMGCLSERYREELKTEIPEVDIF